MNHSSLVRPILPGSTPPSTGKNIYGAVRLPPAVNTINNSNNFQQNNAPPSPALETEDKPQITRVHASKMHDRNLQQQTMNKLVAKLPFQLRETVSGIVNMAFAASENMVKDLDVSRQEVMALRTELHQRTSEIIMLKKLNENQKSKIQNLEGNCDTLKDDIDSRQNFTIRNRTAMTRLAMTNRMLIDALDALQEKITPSNRNLTTSQSSNNLLTNAMDGEMTPGQLPKGQQLTPLHTRAPKSTSKKEYEDRVLDSANIQNDKLRESLLKIAREHYSSVKNAELLEVKVSELKGALRGQEQLNRILKSELDEIKLTYGLDDHANEEALAANSGPQKARSFGSIDEKFQSLLDRNLVDPIEGIQKLRRIIAHMSVAPNTLNLREMIWHVVSRHSMHIFDADMICLYIVKPGSQHILHKFNSRSKDHVNIDMTDTKSLASQTISTGKSCRCNVPAKSSYFDPDIDGCKGVNTKKLLSVPLFNTQTTNVIGALQFINKGTNNESFTEVDEVLASLFAHQASLLLTSCVMYDAVFFHSQLLQGLLGASITLFSVLGDSNSIASVNILSLQQILHAMEAAAQDILKCPIAKAFIVSKDQKSLNEEEISFLKRKGTPSSRKNPSNREIDTCSRSSGIAGHVIETKSPYLMESSAGELRFDYHIDLDPLDSALYTVPIVSLNGAVLGCLQLTVGSRSPSLKPSEDPHDYRLQFAQAAEWLAHQLAPPLQYMLQFLGRYAERPVSTPSRLIRASIASSQRVSFITNSERVIQELVHGDEEVAGIMNTFNAENDTFEPISISPIGHHDSLKSEFSPAIGTHRKVRFDSEDAASADTLDKIKLQLESKDKELGELAMKLQQSTAEALKLKEELAAKEEEYGDMMHKFWEARQSATDKAEEYAKLESLLVSTKEELAKELSTKTQELQEQLKQEQSQRLKYQDQVALLSSSSADVNDAFKAMEESISSLNANLESSNKEKDSLLAQIEELQNAVASHERAKEDQETKTSQAEVDLRASLAEEKDRHQRAQTTIQSLQTAQENLEKEFSDYKRSAQSQIDALRSQASESQRSDETQALLRISALETENSALTKERAEFQAKIESLNQSLAEKDKLQTILQQQVVKLAEQNMQSLDKALKKNNAADHESTASADALPSAEPSVLLGVSPEPSISLSIEGKDQTRPVTSSQVGKVPGTDDWQAMVDESGNTYYYNTTTGESSWTNPAEDGAHRVGTGAAAGGGVDEWQALVDEHGRTYYYNSLTGESSWVHPNENADEEDDDDGFDERRKLQAGTESIFNTNASAFSASAGDYTIEL